MMHDESEPLTQRVAGVLAKLNLVMKQCEWTDAGRRGLTPLQTYTLRLIRQQPATVSELSAQLAQALPTTSELLRTLHERGFITKARAKGDARVVFVRL